MQSNKQKADAITYHFFSKFALVVDDARVRKANAAISTQMDMWFNLDVEMPNLGKYKEELRPYRNASTPPAPPPLELHVLLAVPNHAPAHTSMLNEKSSVSSHIFLETWRLVFVPLTALETEDTHLTTVYTHCISLLRSLFTLLRILPAWSICKRLGHFDTDRASIEVCMNSSLLNFGFIPDTLKHHRPLKNLHNSRLNTHLGSYRGDNDFGSLTPSSVDSDTALYANTHGLSTSTHTFPLIIHPYGTLNLSATYLSDPVSHINTLFPFLSSQYLLLDEVPFMPALNHSHTSSLLPLPEGTIPSPSSLYNSPPSFLFSRSQLSSGSMSPTDASDSDASFSHSSQDNESISGESFQEVFLHEFSASRDDNGDEFLEGQIDFDAVNNHLEEDSPDTSQEMARGRRLEDDETVKVRVKIYGRTISCIQDFFEDVRLLHVFLANMNVSPEDEVLEGKRHEFTNRLQEWKSSNMDDVGGDLSSSRLLERKREELLDQLEDWQKSDALEMIIKYGVIRAAISGLQDSLFNGNPSISDAAGTTLHKPLDPLPEEDLNYLSLMIGRMVTNTERYRIMALPAGELHAVMDVLQMLIDGEYGDYHLLERFLKKLVRRREILPSYLFLSGIRRLGSNPISGGGYADVWKGRNGDKIVALKVLRIFDRGVDRNRVHREFCKEAMIWRQLKNSNILPFHGVCEDQFSPQFAMVSPWMENGDMMAYLKRYDGADRMKIVGGVAFGLRYLHTLTPEVVHGDLRGANVLMDDNHNPRIADFGLSQVIDTQCSSIAVTSFNGKGTMRWQAPELLSSNRLEGKSSGMTSKSDVYAYACVCLEAFTGEAPFSNLRDGAVVLEVAVHDRRPTRPSGAATRRGLDDHMWDLMNDCWKTNREDRPDMSEVVNRLALGGRQYDTAAAHERLERRKYA